MTTSTNNAEHYEWGSNCHGWHLLKTDSLSVIQETMPPGTSEQLHYHENAQQLFYILSGTATFDINGKQVTARPGESLHIPPGTHHRISNSHNTNLTFILVSQPKAHGDRINL